MQCAKCHAEFSDREILRAAGRIRAAMRQKRGGGRPPALYPCSFCAELQLGRASLELHERVCPKRPPMTLEPLTDADLAALAWLPE